MEDIKKEYKRLANSKQFKNKGYFCGAFIMSDAENLSNSQWQIDFYNEENSKITTYLMQEEIEVTDNADIFKEEKTEMKEITIENINIDADKAISIAKYHLEKNNEEAVKVIIILQQEDIPIWNISYMTKKFNLLNMKISAEDGKLIQETTTPLLSFKQ